MANCTHVVIRNKEDHAGDSALLHTPILEEEPPRFSQRRLIEGHLESRHPLRVLPLTPTYQRLRLEWCRAQGNWTAAEWNQVVFSDESILNLSTDDNRVRVWRPCGERINPVFDLQRHTDATASVMVWGVIAYNTRSLLLFIRCSGSDSPVVCPLHPATTCVATYETAPISLFQQDNARPHTVRVS
ncbi:transposable element Tcb2 transposase [Trichonephila clavipes]|nr:transposable element Tcb2 transposase [Trichonephila clavipes]